MGLARTEHIGSYSLDGGVEVDEERGVAPALVTAVDDAECLIDGKDLRIEDLPRYNVLLVGNATQQI